MGLIMKPFYTLKLFAHSTKMLLAFMLALNLKSKLFMANMNAKGARKKKNCVCVLVIGWAYRTVNAISHVYVMVGGNLFGCQNRRSHNTA